MKIAVGTKNPGKVAAVSRACAGYEVLAGAVVSPTKVASGVSDQPGTLVGYPELSSPMCLLRCNALVVVTNTSGLANVRPITDIRGGKRCDAWRTCSLQEETTRGAKNRAKAAFEAVVRDAEVKPVPWQPTSIPLNSAPVPMATDPPYPMATDPPVNRATHVE
jgi:hypothetical protein